MIPVIHQLDLEVVRYLVHQIRAHESLALASYFMAEVVILSIIPALVWIWYRGRPARLRPSGKKAVVLALLTVVFVASVKLLTAMVYMRERPFVADPTLEGGMSGHLDPQSFPSGHTMLMAAIGCSLWFSGYKKMGGLILVLGVLVAFGRVATGLHYPTDVLAGFLIGSFVAWLLHRESSSLKAYLPDHD